MYFGGIYRVLYNSFSYFVLIEVDIFFPQLLPYLNSEASAFLLPVSEMAVFFLTGSVEYGIARRLNYAFRELLYFLGDNHPLTCNFSETS